MHQSHQAREAKAIAIKKKINHRKLNISTTLQVVALEVYLVGKGRKTICSIYFPLLDMIRKEDMLDFTDQLPTLVMMLQGVFKAYDPVWESKKNKHKRENDINNSR